MTAPPLSLEWIAGFTDGEGCFGLHRQKDGLNFVGWYPRFILTQANRLILERVAETLGVQPRIYSRPGQSPTAKRVYFLHVAGSPQVRHVCKQLRPHLQLKGPQVDLLLESLSVPGPARKDYATALSAMKRVQEPCQ